MILKAAILFLLSVAAVGLGAPLVQLLAPGADRRHGPGLGLAGLLGLFVAASLARLVNFFVPVSPAVAVSLFAVGWALALPRVRRLRRTQWAWYLGLVLAVTPFAVLLPPGYDSGVYHLPHQLWLVSNKAVFGLSNLNEAFGYNSLAEPLLALGWLGGNDLAVVPLITGLFDLFLLLAVVDGANTDDPVAFYMKCVTGVGFLWMCVLTRVTGWGDNDLPTAVCVFSCLYWGATAVMDADRDALVLLYFFAVFAGALKLSGAVVLLFPLGLSLAAARRRLFRLPLGKVVTVALLLLPTFASDLVVSGCLAFPVQMTCLPVPWQSSQAASDMLRIVSRHSRGLEPSAVSVPPVWAWFPDWITSAGPLPIYWVGMVLTGVIVAAIITRVMPTRRPPVGLTGVFAIYAVGATTLWFLSAPEWRYAAGPLLALALLPGLAVVTRERRAPVMPLARWIPASLLVASVIVGAGRWWQEGIPEERSLLHYHPVHVAKAATRVDGGVRRPVVGESCFLSPVPCSPVGVSRESRLGSYRAFLPAQHD